MISSGSRSLCQKPSACHGRCPWRGGTVKVAMRGVYPFTVLVQHRQPRIVAEHPQALPHPSSACSSHPKAVSGGRSGSGDHPKRQFTLMSLVNTPPSKAEVLPGAGKGHGAGMDGFEAQGAPGVSQPRRTPGAVAGPAWPVALPGDGTVQPLITAWPKPGLCRGHTDAPQEAWPAG